MSGPELRIPTVRRLTNFPALEIVTLQCADVWQDPVSGRVYMIEGTFRKLAAADKEPAPEPAAPPPPQPSPLKGEGAIAPLDIGGADA